MSSYETKRKEAVLRLVLAEQLKKKAMRLAAAESRTLSSYVRLLIERAVAEAEAAAKA
jgi:hypothetical protein